jgi:glucose-1-phosphate cytidylyltransferase
VKRIREYVGNEPFMLTYGDGVSDVNINALVSFHKEHGKIATLTSTQPSGRFGALSLADSYQIVGFQEKPKGDGGWVNAGFFVLQPEVFDYIDGDDTVFESGPLETLVAGGELYAYKHHGFWQPMDTVRDKALLEDYWTKGRAPWKRW